MHTVVIAMRLSSLRIWSPVRGDSGPDAGGLEWKLHFMKTNFLLIELLPDCSL
jgi:hypothetical protein